MKDYYAILGIHRGASAADVKRAYRRLAVSFHPDKNPDPAAENIFKEINEAYDVLGDPDKRMRYDDRLQNPAAELIREPPARRHRDPAYHPKRPTGPRPGSDAQKMHEFMAAYLSLANRLTYLSAVVTAVLIIDFSLPKTASVHRITNAGVTRVAFARSSDALWTITTDAGRRFQVDFHSSGFFRKGGEVKVRTSRLLDLPVTIEGQGERQTIRKSIYGNFIFVPAVLMISTILALKFRKNVERGFNYGIVSFLSLMLTLAVFLILPR